MQSEEAILAVAKALIENPPEERYEQRDGEMILVREYRRSAIAALEAALSAAEPVAWYWEDKTGCVHITMDRPDVQDMAEIVGCVPSPLYADPPPPSVVVKALEWDEFSTELSRHFQSNTILGQYQIAYLGEFECWQLYSPQKSSVWKENFSRHKSSEEAKAAAQADYEARIRSALTAQVQDVAGWQLVPKEPTEEMIAEACSSAPHVIITYTKPDERDGTIPLIPLATWRAMLAAAPAAKAGGQPMTHPPATCELCGDTGLYSPSALPCPKGCKGFNLVERLGRRIHNQRVRLRYWEELFNQHVHSHLHTQHPRHLMKAIELGNENFRLRQALSEAEQREKDALGNAQCACGYDEPDVICDYHRKKYAEVRAKALEDAAQAGYVACAETRHVTLGDKVADAVRALKDEVR